MRPRSGPPVPGTGKGAASNASTGNDAHSLPSLPPLVGDLLQPEQVLLWCLRAGAAVKPPGQGRFGASVNPSTGLCRRRAAPGYSVVENAVSPEDAPDVWAATRSLATLQKTPWPALDAQKVSPLEQRVLGVAWALQTGTRIGGWPALLTDWPVAAHPTVLASLTLIIHVLAERGFALPIPASSGQKTGPNRAVSTALPRRVLTRRPGLAGQGPEARILVQTLRIVLNGPPDPSEAGRQGRVSGMEAAAGYLLRQGQSVAIAGGLEALVVEALEAAPRGQGAAPKLFSIGCPCLSRDEATLLHAVSQGAAPAGGWLPHQDPVVDATLQALMIDLPGLALPVARRVVGGG